MLDYRQKTVPQYLESARLGELVTGRGAFSMPAFAPQMRTRTDYTAFFSLASTGLMPSLICPQISLANNATDPILTYRNSLLQFPLFVIPDAEPEAFSNTCLARVRIRNGTPNVPAEISGLLSCGLSSRSTETGSSLKYTKAWADIKDGKLLVTLYNWLKTVQSKMRADAFMIPLPLVRKTESSELPFTVATEMLVNATSDPKFHLLGVEFLLDDSFFDDDVDGKKVRKDFLARLRAEQAKEDGLMKQIIFGFKMREWAGLNDPSTGPKRRTNLSEFLVKASEIVRSGGGMVAFYDVGNYFYGLIDSGCDVVTVKASGRTGVERFTPIKRKTKTGYVKRTYIPPEPPTLFNFDNLAEMSTEEATKYFEDYGSLPLPNGIDVQEYWEGTAKGATEYTAKVRMAGIEDNISYYLDAANRSDIPIKESLRDRVNRTVVPQLLELCPTLSK